MDLNELTEESKKIREAYHNLEEKYHGRKWQVQEDALAMSTDVGLINRFIMDSVNIWPAQKTDNNNLQYKIGEVMWWLAVIAEKNDIDLNTAVEQFIDTKKHDFNLK
ncbi:MazG-like protein [Staphylococcus gallinarum]|uniref:MazG-like protein n=1 Tax=Staphylococcus gallinarum TaxID=1293 RepID=UPI0030C3BF46